MKTNRRPLLHALVAKLFRRRRPDPVTGKFRRRARRYIPPEIGLEQFFRTLRDRKVRYVVLRWFDELPRIKPGGDVDLLIHDDDIEAVSDLFVGEVRGVACDLFSVSGLRGSSFRGIPYLPPAKAAGMLERAVVFRDLMLVPGPQDYFLSLAYHAIYQKGLRSGLPTSASGLQPEGHPRHDYAGILAKLAAESGIDVPITMEGLDEYLTGCGWHPSPPMMATLAKRNDWVAARYRQ